MSTPDDLPNDVAELKAIVRTQQDQNARLEALVASFKKALFGSKSEKVDLAQYELELEDIETAIAQVEAEIDADERTAPVRPPKPRQTNRGSLPKHLERVEVVIEPERSCACGTERHVIGEDVSERLDIIPAQFRVIVTRRPKYACRSCEGGIAQAPAPAHIIAGGMPTEATLAHVLVSKYADHLPLYRQAQIYSRQGIDLDRSTLAAWVGKSAFELTPVYDALMADLKRSTKLFMDETPAPVLAPGRKRTKTGYFWALARDGRPWGSEDPPGVAFTYAPGRSGQHADNILKGFSGTLQVDGYAGYNRLLKRPAQDVRLAYCWAHARRKLHDVTQSSTAPIAQEGLAQRPTSPSAAPMPVSARCKRPRTRACTRLVTSLTSTPSRSTPRRILPSERNACHAPSFSSAKGPTCSSRGSSSSSPVPMNSPYQYRNISQFRLRP